MEEEQNQNQEEQQEDLLSKVVEVGKQVGKQAGKKVGKKAVALVAKILLPFLPWILLFGIAIGGLYVIKDKVQEVIGDISTSIKTFIGIGDNGPVAPSPEEMIKLIDEELEKAGIDKNDLRLGNEEQTDAYLYKFMAVSQSTRIAIYTR